MTTEPKLVGFFGGFGTGNFGNDGSLESVLLFLRRTAPSERLICICGDPRTIRREYGLDAISIYYRSQKPSEGRVTAAIEKAMGRITIWFYAARHLRRLKVLVVPGTGLLDDFTVRPLGWPVDLLSWFLLARIMGVKVILVSIGAGPIRHPISRLLMKAAAKATHYRSYRDTISKSFMDSIGFDTHDDPVYPDVAFTLPASQSERVRKIDAAPPVIGLGVMSYDGWRKDGSRKAEIYEAYLDKMTAYVLWLLERGHRVRLLIGQKSDERMVADLQTALRAERFDLAADAVLYTPSHTLHDVMDQMAEVDVVVATRYHNVVCALKMGRPTISIGYAGKNDALLEAMGLAEFCQPIERLDVELLKTQTVRLLAEREGLASKVRAVLKEFENKGHEHETRLKPLICNPSKWPRSDHEGTGSSTLRTRLTVWLQGSNS